MKGSRSVAATRPGLDTPPQVLPQYQERWARSAYYYSRREVARSPYITPEALALLITDDHPKVRSALARNPCFTLTPDLPVGLLLASVRGRALMDAELTDCDPSVLAALTSTWAGTLTELRTAAMTLAP